MLKGRVLEDKKIGGPKEEDSWWRNLCNMYRRFDSDVIVGAKVRARYHDDVQEAVTNEEGYFEVAFHPQAPPNPKTLWHDVQIELMDEIVPGQTQVTATGQVLVPPADARIGIISDMDDTVLKTHATNLWRMVKLTFLNNARTRLPFEGVAAFYRALQRGPNGDGQNPIFYVSSSAWNIYDLLVDFLDLNEIPAGPLLLRDLGLGKNQKQLFGHEHKLQKIERIQGTYPELPFVLIGDSGQDDPTIYRQVVLDFPGRIAAVYIRDIEPNHRQSVEIIAEEIKALGVDLLLVENTVVAAVHAAEKGWISPNDLPDIRKETDIDRAEESSEDRLAPV
jgi:phosphatidate phosphatase APP1